MADQRDELALVHQQVEAIDHGQRPLGRRIYFGDVEEFEIPLLQASAGGVAIGLGRAEQADRLDLGQYAGVVRRGFRARFVELAETGGDRSEEHTSELQSLMRISYAVFCLKKKKTDNTQPQLQLHDTKK